MEHTNKQARADVRVRIGRAVVAVEVEQAAAPGGIAIVAADVEDTPARVRVHAKARIPSHKLHGQSR